MSDELIFTFICPLLFYNIFVANHTMIFIYLLYVMLNFNSSYQNVESPKMESQGFPNQVDL